MRTPRPVDKRIPRARRLRRDVTDAERKLWWHLRRLPIEDSHFRRQATVGPYFVDFACHTKRIVIELDGGQHATPVHEARDVERDAFLSRNGYRVLRFWNNDVMQDVDGGLSVIFEVLNAVATPPTPDPSPPLRGGRGSRGGSHA